MAAQFGIGGHGQVALGAVALVTLLVTHSLVAFARRHSQLARIIDQPPRVLVAWGGAGAEPGPLMRDGLSAAGYRDVGGPVERR